MHEERGPALALARGRRFIEGGIQEGAGRAGGQAEGILLGCLLNGAPVVGKFRHVLHGAERAGWREERGLCPIGPEMELAIGMAEAFEKMRRLEIGLHIDPVFLIELLQIGAAVNAAGSSRSIHAASW